MPDIKRKNNDSIGYIGSVEFGLIRNNKRYPKITANAGTYNLFEFLCNCIVARLNPNVVTDLQNRPGNLKLFDSANQQILSYGIGFSDLVVSGEDSSDPYCSVKFYFLIPGTSIFRKSIKKVALTAINDFNKIYAEASFQDDIIIDSIDTNVYVEWTLTIKNAKEV